MYLEMSTRLPLFSCGSYATNCEHRTSCGCTHTTSSAFALPSDCCRATMLLYVAFATSAALERNTTRCDDRCSSVLRARRLPAHISAARCSAGCVVHHWRVASRRHGNDGPAALPVGRPRRCSYRLGLTATAQLGAPPRQRCCGCAVRAHHTHDL